MRSRFSAAAEVTAAESDIVACRFGADPHPLAGAVRSTSNRGAFSSEPLNKENQRLALLRAARRRLA